MNQNVYQEAGESPRVIAKMKELILELQDQLLDNALTNEERVALVETIKLLKKILAEVSTEDTGAKPDDPDLKPSSPNLATVLKAILRELGVIGKHLVIHLLLTKAIFKEHEE